MKHGDHEAVASEYKIESWTARTVGTRVRMVGIAVGETYYRDARWDAEVMPGQEDMARTLVSCRIAERHLRAHPIGANAYADPQRASAERAITIDGVSHDAIEVIARGAPSWLHGEARTIALRIGWLGAEAQS